MLGDDGAIFRARPETDPADVAAWDKAAERWIKFVGEFGNLARSLGGLEPKGVRKTTRPGKAPSRREAWSKMMDSDTLFVVSIHRSGQIGYITRHWTEDNRNRIMQALDDMIEGFCALLKVEAGASKPASRMFGLFVMLRDSLGEPFLGKLDPGTLSELQLFANADEGRSS
jgi:hypothetical protein